MDSAAKQVTNRVRGHNLMHVIAIHFSESLQKSRTICISKTVIRKSISVMRDVTLLSVYVLYLEHTEFLQTDQQDICSFAPRSWLKKLHHNISHCYYLVLYS